MRHGQGEPPRADVDPTLPAVAPARGSLVRVLLGIALVLAVLGFGVVASRPAAPPADRRLTPDVAAARQAVDDLLHPGPGRDAIAALPADFTAVSHVIPVHLPAPDGTVRSVHVDGGCSTPWGDDNTRWDYSVGCKAHDLGYDLLRYAEAKGQPLAPQLRRQLDDKLSSDMHAQCGYNPQNSAGTCEVVASLFSAGLVLNSWHQRWGPPKGEPVGPWAFGLLVVVLLLAVRIPALVRPRRSRPVQAVPVPIEGTEEHGTLATLRLVSLAGIVLGESVLALVHWGPGEPSWVWPVTWLFQLAPLFFFAGGHANLLAWRATTAAGGGFGSYLSGRICWLIRPVLAFVAAWLVVPLALELLDAPDPAIAAVGRLVVQPLWLLGLYLIAVAATPGAYALHKLAPLPVLLGAVGLTAGIATLGASATAGDVAGVALALVFQQLAFHYADGTLQRPPRWARAALAAAALLGLIALTTVGGHPRLVLAEPSGSSSLVPSLAGVLLLGIVQVCLLTLYRARTTALAGRVSRALGVMRTAPMTTYLLYLGAVLVLAGVIGTARTGGFTFWITRPQTWLAIAIVAVPTLLAFRWFERSHVFAWPVPRVGSTLDGIAATLGVGYGAMGVLGFAVTGITGAEQTPMLFGLALDPMGNLIHLLLGWYLLHCVRIGTSAHPVPWVLTGVACVPPMMTTVSGVGTVVHAATIATAMIALALCVRPVSTGRAATAS